MVERSSDKMNRTKTRSRTLAASLPGVRRPADDGGGGRRTFVRAASAPLTGGFRHPPHGASVLPPSIMRISTLEESLHATYKPSRGGTGDLSDSSDSSSSSSRLKFDRLDIREYARSVGDNPSVSGGPPLAIGWEYNEAASLSLDDYESDRGPRRTSPEMAVPRSIRTEMLMSEWGVSRSEIAQATRDVVKTKNRRRTTVQNMDRFARAEELAESAKRKCKRFLLRKKRDSALYEEWKREAERARAAIAEEDAAASASAAASSLDASRSSRRLLVEAHQRRHTPTVVIRSTEDDAADPAGGAMDDPAFEVAPRRPSGPKIAPASMTQKQRIVCSEEDDKVSEQSSGAATYEVFGPVVHSPVGATCA